MSEKMAKEFLDQLEKDKKLQAKIKLGLEALVKIAADHNVTEEELSEELQKRWRTKSKIVYSEPPGF
jgi:hemerythrin superfamily protein